ncbi:MAG: hypothetical protein M3Z23_11835 [Acidobacteriota bacterium]|nr:hypothetical protein [Acidobacteriota bacterium]
MNDLDKMISQLERQRGAIEHALSALREVAASSESHPAGSSHAVKQPAPNTPVKRRMSPEGRKRIGDAARKRWAQNKAKQASTKQAPAKTERRLTPAGRKRLSDLMKARWAKKNAAARSGAKS